MAAVEINSSKSESLQSLIDEIKQGMNLSQNKVTPIISNSFRIEEIFRDYDGIKESPLKDQGPTFFDDAHTIDHQLAKKWASDIDYPMSDGHNWARVAQYRQVNPEENTVDLDKVRDEYIDFLKQGVLGMGQNRKGYEEKVKQLDSWSDSLNFSAIATDLDYPAFLEHNEDPLLLLAKLPFPVYITTSYSDFLERALLKAGKFPRRQICFYTGDPIKDLADHLPDVRYKPDIAHPAVYYLYGMEDYRPSLVLSEDNYLDFLMRADGDIKDQKFPSPLLRALTDSRLLLLGYSLGDWDFRTLFRLILKSRETKPNSKQSITIQFKPSLGQNEEKAVKYLEQYFGAQKFKIRWSSTEQFIHDLWDACVNSNIVSI